jgi:hypothetical protein
MADRGGEILYEDVQDDSYLIAVGYEADSGQVFVARSEKADATLSLPIGWRGDQRKRAARGLTLQRFQAGQETFWAENNPLSPPTEVGGDRRRAEHGGSD